MRLHFGEELRKINTCFFLPSNDLTVFRRDEFHVSVVGVGLVRLASFRSGGVARDTSSWQAEMRNRQLTAKPQPLPKGEGSRLGPLGAVAWKGWFSADGNSNGTIAYRELGCREGCAYEMPSAWRAAM